MGRGLGETQRRIGLCLLEQRLDANELVKLVYKARPTKSRLNTIWAALRGMEARGMIAPAGGMTMGGFRRWELTKQGREDIESLKKEGKPQAFKPGVIEGGKT
jgi:hypothetical protein